MSDPELAARAQRAAERLEQSWDRWRRLHGLPAEQAQPVSSYVGYSLAEPWGRPRVVFGIGAEEAERLAALLEQDEGADPRFSQGLLWESEPGAQNGNGTASFAGLSAPVAGRGWEPARGNGAHEAYSAELSAPVADRTGPHWQSERRARHGNGAFPHAGRSGPAADHAEPAWRPAPGASHSNGVADGTSFAGPPDPMADRSGPGWDPGPAGSVQ